MKHKLTADAVMREVWETKERLGRQHGFDVRRIGEAARAKQSSSGHEIIYRPTEARIREDAGDGG